jgi:hypothetical protein
VIDAMRQLQQRVRAASTSRAPDPKMDAYLEKVARHAYKVTDQEVAALLTGGHSEDEIFERTIDVALGAGLEGYAAGLGALEKAGGG